MSLTGEPSYCALESFASNAEAPYSLEGMFHPDGPTFVELIKQALSSTERGYDLLAKKFDYTPFRTPKPIVKTMVEFMAEGSPGGTVKSAVDYCCGTGAALSAMRALCTETLVGVDFSAGMLAEARQAAEAAPGTAAIELVQQDVFSCDFRERFDLATSVGAFGHILPEDEERFLQMIYASLRPGGRFVFVTTRMPPVTSPSYWMARGFNASMHIRNALIQPQFIMYYLTFMWPEISSVLSKVGFKVRGVERRCPAPYEQVVLVEATKP